MSGESVATTVLTTRPVQTPIRTTTDPELSVSGESERPHWELFVKFNLQDQQPLYSRVDDICRIGFDHIENYSSSTDADPNDYWSRVDDVWRIRCDHSANYSSIQTPIRTTTDPELTVSGESEETTLGTTRQVQPPGPTTPTPELTISVELDSTTLRTTRPVQTPIRTTTDPELTILANPLRPRC